MSERYNETRNDIAALEQAATDYRNNGQVEKAVAAYRLAYDMARDEGDIAKAAGMMHMIGVSYKVGNHTAESLDALRQAADLYAKIQDGVGVGRVLRDEAITYAYVGKYDKAEAGLRRSVAHLEGTEAVDERAISEVKLGGTYLKKGRLDEAEAWMQRGWAALKDGDNWFYKLTSLGHLAELAFVRGQYAEADSYTAEALAILEDEGQTEAQARRAAQLHGLRAISARRQGQSAEADEAAAWQHLNRLDKESREYLLTRTGLKELRPHRE